LFLSFNFNSNGNIYYRPVGRTTKTLSEIQTYIDNHDSVGTIYGVFHNNCQHYVRSVIEFLGLPYPPEQSAMKSTETYESIDLGKHFNILSEFRPRILGGGMPLDPVSTILNMRRLAED